MERVAARFTYGERCAVGYAELTVLAEFILSHPERASTLRQAQGLSMTVEGRRARIDIRRSGSVTNPKLTPMSTTPTKRYGKRWKRLFAIFITMKLDLHYVEPSLVDLYDITNSRGPDTEFYLHLAAELQAGVILDLGCGTGLLTRELAVVGRTVIGIDPAPAMLAYARHQPGAERVQWIEGDSGALGTPEADLVIMTGNVAQVFLEEGEWAATLRDIHAALRSGGCLAFESRNPADKAWERWNRQTTYKVYQTRHGPVEEWLEGVSVGDGRVCFECHDLFRETGEELVVKSELRFRSQQELTESLSRAGFTVEHLYGDWEREPVSITSREMVFIARRS
jgi:SAM-dependent methyltransferase